MGTPVKLTRRAQEVAELVALGLTNREIGERLFLSERTAEWHIEQIFNKLGFTSRSQVAAWVSRAQVDAAIPGPGLRPRGNLPAQLTTFIGRDRELSTLFDLVTNNRLVTVTGPGGTGKTRLALRLAEELRPDLPHGAWLCDLAPVTDASLVGDAVARSLGANRTSLDRLGAARAILRDRSVLLLLDNCEHVLSSSALVARDLLTACPGVRIVATSRTALGVIGETVFGLRPLEHDEAIELFRHRAEAAAPGFRLDVRNRDAVGGICRRLDGLPLAIELVVPRLRTQSAQQLAAAALDPAWQVDSDERHGSLRAIADWSYRLLRPNEQALFRRVGVFASWFDAEDAAALAPVDGALIPVLLGGLVEHSMLIHEQTPIGARYRLLETLRAFALAQLGDAGELEKTRLSHAQRMVWLVERIDIVRYDGPSLRPRAAALTDDVRAALSTLLDVDPRRAAWLSGLMSQTWIWSGRAMEGLRWNELALAASPAPSPERCWSLLTQASLLAELGRKDEAEAWFAKAKELEDLPQAAALKIQFILCKALVHDKLANHDSAMRVRQAAIEASSRDGDEWAMSRALNHTAMSMLVLDRAAEAVDLAERSIEICHRIDRTRLPYVMDTLAQAHAFLGDPDTARQTWMEALALCHDVGWGWAVCTPDCLFGLALVAGQRGKNLTALRLHYCAEQLAADLYQLRNSLEDAKGAYEEPIAPLEAELVARLEAELGVEAAARLRAEGEALTPEMAITLAATEG